MSTLRLVAVTAGMGQPSSTRLLTDRLVEAVRRDLAGRSGGSGFGADADTGTEVKVEMIELRDLAVDIANAMVTGFALGRLREALDAVAQADALIAVTPIFTASYSGLFKSFFDVLDKEALDGTPVLIAATGGTARHSLALDHAVRPMFSYLRALVVPTAVYAASEDWGHADGLTPRIERAAGELAGLLAGARPERHKPVDEFDDVVPFEERFARMQAGR